MARTAGGRFARAAEPAPLPVVAALVMVETRKIKPYQRNPRRNDKTVERLVELIPKVGFNVPLVLDRDNVIVKGHTRWKAAIRLGMREIPCVYTDADPETVKLDRLADNRVQEFSEWDEALLDAELAALPEFAVDLSALDFRLAPLPISEPAPPEDDEEADDKDEGDDDPEDEDEGGDDDENGAEKDAEPEDPEPAQAAPDVDADAYDEVVCSKCGAVMFVPRDEKDAA